MKGFVDILNDTQMIIIGGLDIMENNIFYFFHIVFVKNTVRKGELAHNEQFLLFHNYFPQYPVLRHIIPCFTTRSRRTPHIAIKILFCHSNPCFTTQSAFRGSVLGQDTSEPQPSTGETREDLNNVNCRRDMTEILLKAA